jgi:hypothetical protein
MQHVNLFNPVSLRSLGERAGLRGVRLPFFKWMGAGQLWNLPRQFNRNLILPFKRRFGFQTHQWFVKPSG